MACTKTPNHTLSRLRRSVYLIIIMLCHILLISSSFQIKSFLFKDRAKNMLDLFLVPRHENKIYMTKKKNC